MKKLLSILIILSLLLTGCGISEEEVEALKQEAYEEGSLAGYETGFTDGRAKGYESGFSDGRAKGYETGFTDGREKGYKTGFDEGKASRNVSTSASSYATTNSQQTVYTTATGSKYHRGTCQHLRYSAYATTVEQAQAQGYGACKNCNPPQ